jgi:hypothetical protein
MRGCGEDVPHRAVLHDGAGEHHRDPRAGVGDDAEIMRDHDGAEAAQQVEELRLRRDVEAGRR